MTGTNIVSYDEAWAEEAESSASRFTAASGNFISARGGKLSLGDEECPGNQLCVIVLDGVFENNYYEGRYDPETPQPPRCYAIAADKDSLAPHPSMQAHPEYFAPQHHECRGCPRNEFGTADNGKGKACKNRVRLALLPAGIYTPIRGSRDFELEVFTDPKHFMTADIALVKAPPTSAKHWSAYVKQLAASHRRPPRGVVTRLFVENHVKNQYEMRFEMLEAVDNALFDVLSARRQEAQALLTQGYAPPESVEVQGRNGLRGLRK